MTINRKLHARFRRMRLLAYALLTGFSCMKSAVGEPVDVGASGYPTSIIIGNDGVAHLTANIQSEDVQDASHQGIETPRHQGIETPSVERPDLQAATLGGVDPARFGDASTDDSIHTGLPYDPSTKHYTAAEISSLIETESAKIGIDPAYVRLIADIESQFNQFALSETGAIGIMQLMPDTAHEFGVTNPYDAAQNIRGGVSYLKQLLDEFRNPLMAAAAYHCGPQAARNAVGIPDGPRTAKYMVRILNDYYRISESSFAPSTSASPVPSVSYETTASVTPLRETPKHKVHKVPDPPQSVVGVQPDTPHWEAGFVMNLD